MSNSYWWNDGLKKYFDTFGIESTEPIVAQWHHKVKGIWVSIGLNNGLVTDGIKPLP